MAGTHVNFCDDCIHSELAFDPDIQMTCNLGRPVHFVMPNPDEPLQTRQWGWQYAKGFCNAFRLCGGDL